MDTSTILGLIGSAIGGCSMMVAFTFTTFTTKAESQIEADHVKAQQQDIKDDVHDLKISMDQVKEKIDQILVRVKR